MAGDWRFEDSACRSLSKADREAAYSTLASRLISGKSQVQQLTQAHPLAVAVGAFLLPSCPPSLSPHVRAESRKCKVDRTSLLALRRGRTHCYSTKSLAASLAAHTAISEGRRSSSRCSSRTVAPSDSLQAGACARQYTVSSRWEGITPVTMRMIPQASPSVVVPQSLSSSCSPWRQRTRGVGWGAH
jgi:hypothetical protein